MAQSTINVDPGEDVGGYAGKGRERGRERGINAEVEKIECGAGKPRNNKMHPDNNNVNASRRDNQNKWDKVEQ